VSQKRPFLLWLICLIFLVAAVIELLQVIQIIVSWDLLLSLHYQPGPFYKLLTGVFFLLIFLLSTVLLWVRIHWAPYFAAATVFCTSVWYWLDRVVLSITPFVIRDQVFIVVLFLIIFIVINLSLCLLRSAMTQEMQRECPEKPSKHGR
jgi:hypothetical protein